MAEALEKISNIERRVKVTGACCSLTRSNKSTFSAAY
jgi:hypothetical protein